MKSTQLSALRSNVLSSLPLYQAISLSRFLIPFFICSFLSAHPIPFHRAVCNLLKSHYKCDDRLILGLSLLLPLYGSLLLPYCARAPQEWGRVMEESNFKTRLKREGGGLGKRDWWWREREMLPNKYFKLSLACPDCTWIHTWRNWTWLCVRGYVSYPTVPSGYLFSANVTRHTSMPISAGLIYLQVSNLFQVDSLLRISKRCT